MLVWFSFSCEEQFLSVLSKHVLQPLSPDHIPMQAIRSMASTHNRKYVYSKISTFHVGGVMAYAHHHALDVLVEPVFDALWLMLELGQAAKSSVMTPCPMCYQQPMVLWLMRCCRPTLKPFRHQLPAAAYCERVAAP